MTRDLISGQTRVYANYRASHAEASSNPTLRRVEAEIGAKISQAGHKTGLWEREMKKRVTSLNLLI